MSSAEGRLTRCQRPERLLTQEGVLFLDDAVGAHWTLWNLLENHDDSALTTMRTTMRTTAHKYPPRPGDGKKDANPSGAVDAAISAGLTPDKWHETADGWRASPVHVARGIRAPRNHPRASALAAATRAAFAESARDFAASMRVEGALDAALRARGLRVVRVEADGNCLFRAVAHQLHDGDGDGRHAELRARCCDHVAARARAFAPFVPPDSADTRADAREAFDGADGEGDATTTPVREQLDGAGARVAARVKRMRRDGVWGDHVEISALAQLTGRDVEIYSADAPGADPLKVTAAPLVATPTPRGGGATTDDDEDDEPLPPSYGRAPAPVTALPLPVVRLSYHGGNHYNSVVPLDEDAAETESQGSAE